MNKPKPKNVREWFAFFGGEESGSTLELASKIWDAAIESIKIRPVTVLDIVHNHLLEIGADGLCNSHGCGCGLDQLVSCGNIMEDCEAAKRVKCVPQESCSCDEPSDFCYIPFNTELDNDQANG